MHRPNTFPSLNLKIFLPHVTHAEMIETFIFGSGSCDNFLNFETYEKLCDMKMSKPSKDQDPVYKTRMANGEPIEFPYILKKIIIKFEDGFPLPVRFIVNDTIKRNIICVNALRPYMRWVLGIEEFYVLRRDHQ